ncbi:MAG: M3 family metallopeptidase, partial [Bacteroidetes bacterium]|nr:M3 family metallopeptidase [Bacteroidota bacterium]
MRTTIGMSIIAIALLSSCGGSNDENKPRTENNPFFSEYNTPFGVPPFGLIKPEHYKPAFEEGINQILAEIEAITTSEETPDFKNTIEPYSYCGDLLDKVSSVFYNMLSTNTNDTMQKLAAEISPMMAKQKDDVLLNARLFERIKTVFDKKAEMGLNAEQLRLVEEIYKDFVRGGALLAAEDQEKLRNINEELSLLSLKFGDNVLGETNSFKLWIDNTKDLEGIPQGVIDAAALAAKENGQDGKWLFNLQYPSYTPFMTYCANRDLRKKMFEAYSHKGNNGSEFDNNQKISKLVSLRYLKARLLGFDSYADFVVDRNMSGKPEKVYELLAQVWKPAKARAIGEAEEMQKLIAREGGKFSLEPWDWFYYAEKVRKEKYDLDEEMLRPYFKLENVRNGVFDVANKLYGITFLQIKDIPVFHPDAMAFEVKESNGDHLGVLYMDFFPRASKRGGAWCTSFREQHRKDGKAITPVVSVVCNFTPPSGDKPSLLSYEEVETLFHEFGHALHSLFCNITYPRLGNVPRDFVELPSQVMEHWAARPEVLKQFARHYKTGEVIPDELIQKITNSGHFNQGFATVEYVAASVLDMDYHCVKDTTLLDPQVFEKTQMEKLGIIRQIIPRYRSTYFSHVFAGGYSAGYYGYLWAEVLDADAFEAFLEAGNIFDQKTAQSFRKNVLEKAGTEDAMKMYIDFRGKEPGV